VGFVGLWVSAGERKKTVMEETGLVLSLFG
jgi:hypothetical protein